MPSIIAVANEKGGVGKTTTVVNLAAALANRGKRVLCVDLDSQQALTASIVGETTNTASTVYDAFDDPAQIREAITPTQEGFDVAVGSTHLAGKEIELANANNRHAHLTTILKQVDYEFVLIDCPPSLGLLTVNGLTAARWVLIPVACEYLALRGLALLTDTITRIRDNLNPNLEILGILPTLYESRTLHAQEVTDALNERFGDLVFSVVVKRTVRFRETPIANQSILTYSPKSQGATAYKKVTQEVLARA